MGLYVKVKYGGDWSGEDSLTETVHETTGALYRALSGQDKARSWEALGRCIGKVYVDAIPPLTETNSGEVRRPEPIQVGWVFEARDPDGEKGRREAWVTVHTAPDTVVRTEHFADFE